MYGNFKDSIRKSPSDEDVANMIKDIIGLSDTLRFQKMDKYMRADAIRKLRENGATIRQLSRLTAINRNVIARA